MKVILLHEVPGLGQAGDVKEVADGYARNYLLPRELVTPATKANMATLTDRVRPKSASARKWMPNRLPWRRRSRLPRWSSPCALAAVAVCMAR